jgi:hypothetical protein
MPDGFLNVDLEVGARTRAALAPLLDALRMVELFRGRIGRLYRVHYEVHVCTRDASSTIDALADRIEALRPPARRAWNAAPMRDFNIGVELDRGVRNIELALDRDAVRRVIALGGRIVFTAYQVVAMQAPRRRRRVR